jgi:hypothetical protein
MPNNVIVFERLMYASVSIGLLSLILDASRQAALPEVQAAGGLPFVAVVALAGIGILLVLIWLTARKGKNWARFLFAGLFVIGLWPALQNIDVLLGVNPMVALLAVAQIVIQVAAIYFIFTGDAGPWFQHRDTPA